MSKHLTIRETQIVILLADGATWRTTSEIMDISHSTLKNHLTNIAQKWNVSGRTQIVAEAWRRGLGKEY